MCSKTNIQSTVLTQSNNQATSSKGLLKVAMDVHLARYVIAVQYNQCVAPPTQTFSPSSFEAWIRKQLDNGWQVVTCYEAGPLGYKLHRTLTAMGVTNYVICPKKWDDQNKRVKTDRTDAIAMLSLLDRFLAGNTRVFSFVRVPSEEEERRRSLTRVRHGLNQDLCRIAARGRGLALFYGYQLKGRWYGPRNWPNLKVPDWLHKILEPLQAAASHLHKQVDAMTRSVEASSPATTRPFGMGPLSEQVILRELCDPKRFKNRRQVSSYIGLCPGENSSGDRRSQGHITKVGNPRLRWALCEVAWRLVRYQPNYRLCKKWRELILDPKTRSSRRKQLIVALARGFGVDFWRLSTGQTTAEKLGLKMSV